MNILDEYFEYLNTLPIAHATALSYRRDAENYKNYLGRRWKSAMLGATEETLGEYIETMRLGGKSDATVHRNAVSLRSLYRFLKETGAILNDPCIGIRLETERRKLPTVLSEREVVLLLEQPEPNTLKGCRDKAMLELLYATGMRVSELVGLDLDEVNISTGAINLKSSDHTRFIPLGRAARKALDEYLKKARPMMAKDGSAALFLNLNGRRMSRQGFWKLMKEYQAKAGIAVNITPHTLRHSFATHLLQNGADIALIQEMLGNSDLAYTKIYLDVKENKIAEEYQKAHPRA